MKKWFLVLAIALALMLASGALADVTAVLADAGQAEEGFVAIVSSEGKVYSQLAVESFASLIRENELAEDESIAKVAVVPAGEQEYPYLYPENEWQIRVYEDALPAWYTEETESAILAAFEGWKTQAYSIFDPTVILSLVNPQTIEVSEADVTEDIQAALDKWADVDSNWMVCYVRNAVPTTTQGAVGKSIANDAWNYVVNMVWTQTGEDLAGHSQVDLIASYIGSAFPGISTWEGYFGAETGYPFASGAKLLAAGFLYNHGLVSAKQVKEFDEKYDPEQYKDLTVLATPQESDTGSAFAVLVDEEGNTYWSLGTDYVSGLYTEFNLDPTKVVALNVGPKNERQNISAGTTYTAEGWIDLGNGYFATGAWETPEAEKPDFFQADGTANWKMNEDGSVEPAGEDMTAPGATVNPGKYTYAQEDGTNWELMLSGNGSCRLTVSTAAEREEAAAKQAEQAAAPRTTYFNVMPPMTEVKSIGPVPAWYDEKKEATDEAAKVAFADWQKQIVELVDVDALNGTMKGLSLDFATELSDEVMANFKEWVRIWNEDAVAGSINISISTLGYKAVGPSVWNVMDDTVLANYKSMDHEGCPGPTTSPSIAAYALATYGKVIDAATDDYMGSTMNDVYSAHVGSFIRGLLEDENGEYVYAVANRLWEDGTIPFFDGEYWYLVSGPDFNPDGNPAVEVIYSATPAELLAE
ncbi:MAG: hypothetical protein IJ188_04810 [Clostridia bacterium]|nr:hypothetical protein [Clostridia bacterium]